MFGVPELQAARLASKGLPTGKIGHLNCDPRVVDGELIVGYDSGIVPLVVHDGRVYAVEDGAPRFANTSLECFVLTVERYERYGEYVVRAKSELEKEEIARTAATEMREIDTAAFADEESYWSIICEQMLYGHL